MSILDGHVSGKYVNGIFYDLKKMRASMRLIIEFGDRSTKTFEVIEKRQLPAAESASVLFARNPSIASQLNLITCAGPFNRASQQYADRIVVMTKLVR